MRTNTQHTDGPDTTSRDDILLLTSGSSVLSLSSTNKLFSDPYLQTSFAGFFIDNIVDQLVAFSFGLSTSFKTTSAKNVPFDMIFVDTHNGWSKSLNAYVVQVPGVYVVSYSLALNEKDYPYMKLEVNDKLLNGLHFGSRQSNGIDILSRTVLTDLKGGDNLASNLHGEYGGAYSDSHYQTSLKGFLYSPHRIAPISWCVLLNAHDNIVANTLTDPLQFDNVLINQGFGWNKMTNRFITPSSGVYYVQLTAGICPHQPTKMELLANGFPYVNVYRQISSHEGCDTRSRAVIIQLQQGDELRIRLPDGYCLQSNVNGYTGFAGFRLYI